MVNKPLISIIIPTFNRDHLIGETLNSILNQSYFNWECIIVDDGSTDNTISVLKKLVKKDSRIKFYQRPKNHLFGGNGARNYGFKKAKGYYVQWFDSDDVMEPFLLEKQLHNIQLNNADFSICLFDVYNHNLTKVNKSSHPYKILDSYYYDYLSGKLRANLPVILFSKKTLKDFLLNEKLLKAQEFEFLQRFFKQNSHKGVHLNESLVKVRRHQDSITESPSPSMLSSAMLVFLNTYKGLPFDTPKHVKFYLIRQYLKYLYISFKEFHTNIFYSYLFNILYFGYFKGILTVLYLAGLYPLVKMKFIKSWQFKKIYKLYR
ncbi:glycosyltransferase family 2 protein [Aestuariivivens sediminis]|uniref:glycosyltransferase family 2 protein n=1 Tax=Aestuariivivens sediminis TaxID=2913557 RepID=UPI001F56B0CD|nr:glycosyltransferase family 2 protein [Aestuariivivens sediminis]